MNTLWRTAALLLLFASVSGCKYYNLPLPPSVIDNTPVVYAAGYYNGGGVSTACYWIDGTKTDLGGGNAYAITVSGGLVYVAGYYNGGINPNKAACYWIDGIKTDLDSDGGNAAAAGIFVAE
jgi:hypothetical protein